MHSPVESEWRKLEEFEKNLSENTLRKKPCGIYKGALRCLFSWRYKQMFTKMNDRKVYK